MLVGVSEGGAHNGTAVLEVTDPHEQYKANKKLARRAREPGEMEIHTDNGVLHYLRQ